MGQWGLTMQGIYYDGTSARRVPADAICRLITVLKYGNGPDFQSSKRLKTISLPGFQLSTM